MNNFIERLMSRKGLYTSFWFIAIIMVAALIYYSAGLVKEVPPIPEQVVSESGEVLYSYDDIVEGKGYFQQFDLMDYGTLLGMGAYLGPDFTSEFFHKRAEFLYDYYGKEMYGAPMSSLTEEQLGAVKVRVKNDFREKTSLTEERVVYTVASTAAYKANVEYLVDFLVNGNREKGFTGGVIRTDEAVKIAAFVDWSQMVSSSIRPGTDYTWSNNWPHEPLVDQDSSWTNVFWSLIQLLLLWTLTIIVFYLLYEYVIKRDKNEQPEPPLIIEKIFPSQEKLLKYVPVVTLFFLLQVILGGYIAHIYTDPANDFIISQNILPFNVMRALHVNIAIIWVTIGWLVGGMFIAPLVGKEDLRFPWLVDVLWLALLVVGAGGLYGIYMGATGELREVWFWLGNEGREYLNLGRVWDIGLVVGLVLWFFMVYTTIRKAKTNNVMVGTIIWSAFGIATLYMAGMAPVHKIMPNFTIDDYYRWWVVHLWVELTFELFAAGVLAYLTVVLGLVPRKTAERIMLFELFLVALSGTLGVGHHVWWQGTDQYWIAIGSTFSALEPIPLVVLMIEAWKEYKKIQTEGADFAFKTPFMWLTGSAILNWFGAGFLGMVINTPEVNYYAHGTYLIMPHGHVAMLGAFGYISIAFIYITARANAMAKGLVWKETLSRWGFWLVTVGIVLYTVPTLVIGFEQAKVASELGYYAARSRETLESMGFWMWIRLVPDTMLILGAALVFIDSLNKTLFTKKA